jgi:flagellin-like protein
VYIRLRKFSEALRIRRRAVSPIVAALLLVAVTLIASVAVVGFVFGIIGGASTGMEETVTPQIYSTSSAYGVLNEQANFTVVVSNFLALTQNGTVQILDASHVVQSAPFSVRPGRTVHIPLTQELNNTGIWIVEAKVNGSVVPRSYSFEVLTNTQDVQFQINEYAQVQQANNTALAALGAAIVSAITSAFAWLKPRPLLTPKPSN